MKAIELYEKYKDQLDPKSSLATRQEAVKNILLDLSTEVSKICEERKVQRISAVIAVIREQNQKWNALCNILLKLYGTELLIRNGFKNFWLNQMPELQPFEIDLLNERRADMALRIGVKGSLNYFLLKGGKRNGKTKRR